MKNPSVQRQQGAALLMMMLALFAISSALAYQFLGDLGQKLKRQNNEKVVETLLLAKESLLAFAASEPQIYGFESNGTPKSDNSVPGIGHFPCPDFDHNGAPDGNNCNSSINNVIGRLPHQQNSQSRDYFLFSEHMSKSIGDFGGNESIWYAVTGYSGLDTDFRTVSGGTSGGITKPRKEPLNNNIVETLRSKSCGNGVLCLDGKPIIAVLIIAGNVLINQNRSSSLDYKQFIDLDNGDNDPWRFISVPVSNTCTLAGKTLYGSQCFNDRVLAITIDEWKAVMLQRVRADKDWKNMCEGKLSSDHWLMRNQWNSVTGICN